MMFSLTETVGIGVVCSLLVAVVGIGISDMHSNLTANDVRTTVDVSCNLPMGGVAQAQDVELLEQSPIGIVISRAGVSQNLAGDCIVIPRK